MTCSGFVICLWHTIILQHLQALRSILESALIACGGRNIALEIESRSKVMPAFIFSLWHHLDKLSKLGQISCIIPYYTEIKDSLYLVSFPSIFSKIGTKKDSLTLKS